MQSTSTQNPTVFSFECNDFCKCFISQQNLFSEMYLAICTLVVLAGHVESRPQSETQFGQGYNSGSNERIVFPDEYEAFHRPYPEFQNQNSNLDFSNQVTPAFTTSSLPILDQGKTSSTL